jgi:hypothetical protein
MSVDVGGAMRTLVVGLGCSLLLSGCAPSRSPSVTPSGEPAATASATLSGVWSGEWVRQDCQEKGGAVGRACGAIPERQQLQLRLTQDGNEAKGELQLGTLRTEVSGSISSGGTLKLTGRATSDEQTLELREWQSTIRGQSMEGRFVLVIVPAKDELGVVTLSARLDGVTAAASREP